MNLIDALPRTNDDNVLIPIGAICDGVEYPGEVSLMWVNTVFADYVGLQVPLTDEQYQGIRAVVSGNWPLNWQRFREQGII